METEYERMAAAAREVACAVADAVSNLARSLSGYIDIAAIAKSAAYTEIKKEHPEWVHRATYSKKKRIRKKYHDRIMRQYWG